MNPIIRHSAVFLLLLFMRVMVPDAILLNLHAHTHTEHAVSIDEKHAKVEKEHKHCPVDKLFDSPFQGTTQVTVAGQANSFSQYTLSSYINWQTIAVDFNYQRGPPVV